MFEKLTIGLIVDKINKTFKTSGDLQMFNNKYFIFISSWLRRLSPAFFLYSVSRKIKYWKIYLFRSMRKTNIFRKRFASCLKLWNMIFRTRAVFWWKNWDWKRKRGSEEIIFIRQWRWIWFKWQFQINRVVEIRGM